MFSTGFLGTSAPFYLDLITLYFAVLPALMFYSISYAIRKQYDKHLVSQLFLFALTLIVVVIFEVGVRISGGFMEFMKTAHISFDFMVAFLIIHVIIALASVVLWSALLYSAIKSYKLQQIGISGSHKKVGYFVFFGMTITSFMGVMIYYFLFMY